MMSMAISFTDFANALPSDNDHEARYCAVDKAPCLVELTEHAGGDMTARFADGSSCQWINTYREWILVA